MAFVVHCQVAVTAARKYHHGRTVGLVFWRQVDCDTWLVTAGGAPGAGSTVRPEQPDLGRIRRARL
ncbi:MAG: hypothetical protein ACYTBS_10940, partial [Planctomycetota bacterium]